MTHYLLLVLFAMQAPAPTGARVPAAPQSAPPAGPTQAAAGERVAAELAEAEGRLRTALATSPNIAAYHESLALVLERSGRLDEALASHREAVRLDSLTVRNRAGLGQLLHRMGRSAEAIPHLQAASAIDRASVDLRKSLAAALLQQSRRDEALAVLRDARRLDSSDSDIERSIKQAEATAPGTGRPNDATVRETSTAGRIVRQGLEWVFGLALVSAAIGLVVPLAWGPIAALVGRTRRPVSPGTA